MLREEIEQMKRERYRGSFGKAASEEVFLYWELRQRSFFIGNSGRGPVTPVIY